MIANPKIRAVALSHNYSQGYSRRELYVLDPAIDSKCE
jgi:hypothetical protein